MLCYCLTHKKSCRLEKAPSDNWFRNQYIDDATWISHNQINALVSVIAKGLPDKRLLWLKFSMNLCVKIQVLVLLWHKHLLWQKFHQNWAETTDLWHWIKPFDYLCLFSFCLFPVVPFSQGAFFLSTPLNIQELTEFD